MIGWDATIVSVEAVPRGALVTLAVNPAHTAGGYAAINDESIETYLWSDGRFQFVAAQRLDDGTPRVITCN